jgi:hypothetical protein
VIAVRSDHELTEETLRRQLRCHLARAATLGYEGPETTDSPIA